jgi:hypothetical protein
MSFPPSEKRGIAALGLPRIQTHPPMALQAASLYLQADRLPAHAPVNELMNSPSKLRSEKKNRTALSVTQ